jgi:hypothetical protein
VRNRILKQVIFWIAGALFAPQLAFAGGPVIIGGTDADDHGNATPSTNQDGWLYLQRGLESVADNAKNAQKVVVCLGCNNQVAANAFFSAFDKSSLPAKGWVRRVVLTTPEFNVFFSASLVAGTTNIFSTGVIYMPSDRVNALGGLSEAQIDLINANAVAIGEHVSRGGGIFAQTQSGVPSGFGWLKTLVPGLTTSTDFAPDALNLTLSARALADFPAITAAVLGSAAHWHNNFGGRLGGLGLLAAGSTVPGVTGGDGPKAVGDVSAVIGGADVNFAADTAQAVPLGGAWVHALLVAMCAGLAGLALRARVRQRRIK